MAKQIITYKDIYIYSLIVHHHHHRRRLLLLFLPCIYIYICISTFYASHIANKDTKGHEVGSAGPGNGVLSESEFVICLRHIQAPWTMGDGFGGGWAKDRGNDGLEMMALNIGVPCFLAKNTY